MARSNTTLAIQIVADNAQAKKGLKDTEAALGSLDKTAQRTATSGINLRNALGGIALFAGGRKAIQEQEEAQATARSTEAVIKSTGNAAGVSAEQQERFVDSLSEMAAVDDEVVAGGVNLLRTFKDIKGGALEQATEAALNLSSKFGSLDSSAIQVGKALQDPIRGLTALRRVGIDFSAQQENLIRGFVESGDKAKAQQVILAELEKQFGGQAAAMATDSDRLKIAVDNAAESAGAALVPALNAAAKAAKFGGDAFGALAPELQTATLGLGALAIVGPKIVDGLSGIKAAAAGVKEFAQGMTAAKATSIGFTAGAAGAVGLALYGIASGFQESAEQARLFQGEVDSLSQAISGGMDPLDALDQRLTEIWRDRGDWFVDHGIDSVQELRALVLQSDSDFKAFADDSEIFTAGAVGGLRDIFASARTEASRFEDAQNSLGTATGDTADEIDTQTDALSGLTGALATASSALTSAATAQAGNVRSTAELATIMHDAEQSVSDAQYNTIEATRALSDARQAASGNSQEYADATDAIADAEDGVRDAQGGVLDAQQKLNEARDEARQKVVDLAEAVRDAARAENDAAFEAKRARQAAADALADPRLTALEKEEKLRDAVGAAQDAKDATTDRAKAEQEYTDAKRRGVEGDQAVIDARRGVADAEDQVREAVKRVGDATQARQQIVVRAKQAERDASKRLEDAIYDESKAVGELAAAQGGAAAGTDAQIARLDALSKTLAPDSPLRKRIQALAAQLAGLNPEAVVAQIAAAAAVAQVAQVAASAATAIQIQQFFSGTPKQNRRAAADSATNVLGDMFRGTR